MLMGDTSAATEGAAEGGAVSAEAGVPVAPLGYLVAIGGRGTPKAAICHAASVWSEVGAKRRRTTKVAVPSPHGEVTNACDNTLREAFWAAAPPAGHVLCKPCSSRLRAGSASQQGGPSPVCIMCD